MSYNHGDYVRVTNPVERGFFRKETVIPAGSVGRIVEVPIFATKGSIYGVTFAVGVGVFHDVDLSGNDFEKVTAPKMLVSAT